MLCCQPPHSSPKSTLGIVTLLRGELGPRANHDCLPLLVASSVPWQNPAWARPSLSYMTLAGLLVKESGTDSHDCTDIRGENHEELALTFQAQ